MSPEISFTSPSWFMPLTRWCPSFESLSAIPRVELLGLWHDTYIELVHAGSSNQQTANWGAPPCGDPSTLECKLSGKIWLLVWNMFFFHILGIIIPSDFHIFQRGWNHQPDILGPICLMLFPSSLAMGLQIFGTARLDWDQHVYPEQWDVLETSRNIKRVYAILCLQRHAQWMHFPLICSMYGIFTNICPKNHPVL